MKQAILPLICLAALVLPNTQALADGAVAETTGGKLIKLEWSGYGTEFQQVLSGAFLTITDKDGKEILNEEFPKEAITSYSATKSGDDELIEIKLLIQSKDTKIDLTFRGNKTPTGDDEIDALVKALKNPDRAKKEGSLLKINSKKGNFEFRDVLLGIYGDI